MSHPQQLTGYSGPWGSSRDKGEGAGERGGGGGDKVCRTLSKVVDIDSRSLESTQVYTYVRTLQITHSNIFSYSMSIILQ